MEVWTTPRRIVPASLDLWAHSLEAMVASSATAPEEQLVIGDGVEKRGLLDPRRHLPWRTRRAPGGRLLAACCQAQRSRAGNCGASTWRRSSVNSRMVLLMRVPFPVRDNTFIIPQCLLRQSNALVDLRVLMPQPRHLYHSCGNLSIYAMMPALWSAGKSIGLDGDWNVSLPMRRQERATRMSAVIASRVMPFSAKELVGVEAIGEALAHAVARNLAAGRAQVASDLRPNHPRAHRPRASRSPGGNGRDRRGSPHRGSVAKRGFTRVASSAGPPSAGAESASHTGSHPG